MISGLWREADVLTRDHNPIRPTARDHEWLDRVVNDIVQPGTFPFFTG